MKLIIGNISFFSSDDEEIEEYTNKERLAIVYNIIAIIECADEEEAEELGEEVLNNNFDSYLIPDVYQNNGDVIYECESDMLPISIKDFKTNYLN